jgi:hypothetical protein
MTITESTVSPSQQLQLTEWIAAVRDLYTVKSAPISVHSDQYNALNATDPNRPDEVYEQFTEEDLGGLYFHYVASKDLPAWPLTPPAWTEEVCVAVEFPIATVAYKGKEWASLGITARLEQWVDVWLEADASEPRDAGEMVPTKLSIVVVGNGRDMDLTIDEAIGLEASLGDVLYTLRP